MMRGLWVKDLLFLKKQVLALIITFILSGFSLAFFGTRGVLIGMAIFSITAAFLMLNSLTFDQQNHGLRFLLTMPITKKQYVAQKYCFLLLTVGISLLLMLVLSSIFAQLMQWEIRFQTILTESYLVALAVLLLLTGILHYQLKNGPEKTQAAMSMIGAVVAVVIGGLIAGIKYTAFGKKIFDHLAAYYAAHGSLLFLILLTILAGLIVGAAVRKGSLRLAKYGMQ